MRSLGSAELARTASCRCLSAAKGSPSRRACSAAPEAFMRGSPWLSDRSDFGFEAHAAHRAAVSGLGHVLHADFLERNLQALDQRLLFGFDVQEGDARILYRDLDVF